MSEESARRGREQRLRERVDLESGLLVRIGDAVWLADCRNVSMGGALLSVWPRGGERPGELVGRSGSLELVHRCGGDSLTVDVAFTVVRVEANDPFPRPFGLGVRFTELDAATSIRLFNLIRWQIRD